MTINDDIAAVREAIKQIRTYQHSMGFENAVDYALETFERIEAALSGCAIVPEETKDICVNCNRPLEDHNYNIRCPTSMSGLKKNYSNKYSFQSSIAGRNANILNVSIGKNVSEEK